MTKTNKSAIIGKILKLTGNEKHFDDLNDKSEEYLNKLLKVCNNLKKQ